jgi:deazaflavin-dependent oxidoreductase (nitroreductase family)
LTSTSPVSTGLRPRRSAAWSITFRFFYRIIRLLAPLVRSAVANGLPGVNGIVEIRSVGRRSGRPRWTLLTLLSHDGAWYIGHPNGIADWIRNAEAAGWVDVEPAGAHGARHAVRRVSDGPERDAVIRATVRQQPFPANLLYRAALRHIAAVGVYDRLVPIDGSATVGSAVAGGPAVTLDASPGPPAKEGDR